MVLTLKINYWKYRLDKGILILLIGQNTSVTNVKPTIIITIVSMEITNFTNKNNQIIIEDTYVHSKCTYSDHKVWKNQNPL